MATRYLVLCLLLVSLQSSCSKVNRNGRSFESILTQVSSIFQVNIPVKSTDITFHYYNRNIRNQDGVALNLEEFNGVINDFNSMLPNYFIAHGSGDSYTSLRSTKDLILSAQDANVFLIDYSKHAAMFYTVLVPLVPKLSVIMGEAVNKLMEINKVPFGNINLIGHSLGAHVAAGIGSYLDGKPNYIIGLDPAGPLFQNEAPAKRLDASDAQFVQVLHTNGGFQGIQQEAGDADFYANGGGMNQPGCGSDLFGACAHARAMQLLRESLSIGGFCARLCSSYQRYQNGECANNTIGYFGGINIDKTVSGKFYFNTNTKSPYSTGEC